jgi:hypothetical protein
VPGSEHNCKHLHGLLHSLHCKPSEMIENRSCALFMRKLNDRNHLSCRLNAKPCPSLSNSRGGHDDRPSFSSQDVMRSFRKMRVCWDSSKLTPRVAWYDRSVYYASHPFKPVSFGPLPWQLSPSDRALPCRLCLRRGRRTHATSLRIQPCMQSTKARPICLTSAGEWILRQHLASGADPNGTGAPRFFIGVNSLEQRRHSRSGR